MNLTSLIRNLETQLKSAEKLAKQYDAQADTLRNKLGDVARIVGRRITAFGTSVKKSSAKSSASPKKKWSLSPSGRAKIIAAQRRRWASSKR